MNIKEAITLYLSYKESLGEKIRGVRYFLLRFERYINPIVDLDEITKPTGGSASTPASAGRATAPWAISTTTE